MGSWLGRPVRLVRRAAARVADWATGAADETEWHEALAETRSWDPDATEVIRRRKEWQG